MRSSLSSLIRCLLVLGFGCGSGPLLGCANFRQERVITANRPRLTEYAVVPETTPAARIACGDVLVVRYQPRPEWDSVASVGIDGRLPLGPAGEPRIAGQTLQQARKLIAEAAQLGESTISIEKVQDRSGWIYLYGPNNDQLQMMPYQGPQRVVDFLKQAEALKSGLTNLRSITVIRPRVAEGLPPAKYRIDVKAILKKNQHHSNIMLRPSDQIYVAEMYRSSFARILPDWLQPLYRRLVRIGPLDQDKSTSTGTGQQNIK